jgi:hypothetical protein
LVVKDRDLLKTRMKITAYNQANCRFFATLGMTISEAGIHSMAFAVALKALCHPKVESFRSLLGYPDGDYSSAVGLALAPSPAEQM